ncbi:MAG: HipA domain-containing protein [Deltaproteobacteria bacterium]|nr:HipA domain-containing protein [Deltaproteobacteria bacterium]
MISKPRVDDCFVYLTLPGATSPVTAGRFSWSKDRRGQPLGRFVYGKSYLSRADAVPIDPVQLRLSDRTSETIALNGVFGALRDAGPDHWGRLVIERHAGRSDLGELDWLLLSPNDRAGALDFGRHQTPPSPVRAFNRTLDLDTLQRLADAIVDDEPVRDDDAAQTASLLLVGTSMGGARPKAVVEDDDGLWLAKFNRRDDRWNSARVEHAMLLLGREAGVATADSRVVTVGGRDVLLVRRFDRERGPQGYRRARMISGLTLLQAEESAQDRQRWSYPLLVEELRRAGERPGDDAPELFRRVTFNALISNSDDHPRNHAVIAWGAGWRLSPAYDLVPTVPPSIERRDLALTVGDDGRFANADNIASQARRFLLSPDEAAVVIDAMEACVRDRWEPVCRAAGVSTRDCATIAGAFAYPGFRAPRSA